MFRTSCLMLSDNCPFLDVCGKLETNTIHNHYCSRICAIRCEGNRPLLGDEMDRS